MKILIDSSVWINYFRGGDNSGFLDSFIDENILCTNYLILAELLPALKQKKQSALIGLLRKITQIQLNINWENIIRYQTICLSNGINKVGIPDLIILDNVIQNDLVLHSLDKYFVLIHNHIEFKLVLI